MDPAHATEAIWIDPLSYNYLKDGPPYLPGLVGGRVASGPKAEVRAWFRQAALEMGQDVGVAFQHCVAEYGNTPMSELAVLLACVRAEAMIHQAHHWQTRGSSYYGDHLLFERVYNDVNGFVDGLAERAVGAGHHVLVQPLMQMSHMVAFSKLFYSDAPVSPEPEEMPLLSLRALLKSMLVLQLAYKTLEVRGLLSNGIDNLLQGIADKQEELVYLLKQRTKTRGASQKPATAFDTFKHEVLARRVTSRFISAGKISLPKGLRDKARDTVADLLQYTDHRSLKDLNHVLQKAGGIFPKHLLKGAVEYLEVLPYKLRTEDPQQFKKRLKSWTDALEATKELLKEYEKQSPGV